MLDDRRIVISVANQMTQLRLGNSAPNNNGQITQAIDSVSGEQISYQYDALKRLSSAGSTTTGSNPAPIWSQTFSYDGFGNLLTEAPGVSQVVDPATNHVTGASSGYDLNGNMTFPWLTYDVENRLTSYNGWETYVYAPDNKRILRRKPGVVPELALYGIEGKLLGTYSLNNDGTVTTKGQYYYFAGKLVVGPSGYPVATDRLGSVRYSGNAPMRFYPYGQEFTPTAANDQKKFGTYMRDSVSGLDYADQRYYNSAQGRFMTVDQYGGSAGVADPGSWNRYAYTGGDPVNRNDPRGLCDVFLGGIRQGPSTSYEIGSFVTQIGATVGYPYGEGSTQDGILNTFAQASGDTPSTQAAKSAILAAARDPGPINIFAFSGGAEAFNAALRSLPNDITSRIQNVTYISPGSFGTQLASSPGGGATTLIYSTSALDLLIVGNAPYGARSVPTSCGIVLGHDVNCLIRSNRSLLLSLSGSPCSDPTTFARLTQHPSSLYFYYLPFASFDVEVVNSTTTFEQVNSTITFDPE